MRHLLLFLFAIPFLASARPPSPDATAASLWRALSHEPGVAADVATLRGLFHPDAVVFGSRERDGRRMLERTGAAQFIDAQATPRAHGFHECEIVRQVTVHDRFAVVYSVVESRRDPAAAEADVIGVNSLQLHRGEDGAWRLLSLYYHLPAPAEAVAAGTSGRCLP